MKIFSDASSQPLPWVVKREKHRKTKDRVGGKFNKGKKMEEKVEGPAREGHHEMKMFSVELTK